MAGSDACQKFNARTLMPAISILAGPALNQTASWPSAVCACYRAVDSRTRDHVVANPACLQRHARPDGSRGDQTFIEPAI
jgi:hypothetical protein